jgi:hypothetical protein
MNLVRRPPFLSQIRAYLHKICVDTSKSTISNMLGMTQVIKLRKSIVAIVCKKKSIVPTTGSRSISVLA